MSNSTIGGLSTRAVLERPVDIADGAGGARRTWAMVAELWVALEIATNRQGFGGDRVREDRLASASTGRITLRYRADIAPGMRFCIGARRFGIQALADPNGERRWIVCRVEEDPR